MQQLGWCYKYMHVDAHKLIANLINALFRVLNCVKQLYLLRNVLYLIYQFIYKQ